jgi:hypothetical protein
VAAISDKRNISLRMRLDIQADAVFQSGLFRASTCACSSLEPAFTFTQVNHLPFVNCTKYGAHTQTDHHNPLLQK